MGDTMTQQLLKRPMLHILSGCRKGSEHEPKLTRMHESDTYISNGHWLVAKARLSDKTLDYIRAKSRVVELSDEHATRVIPSGTETWTVTDETWAVQATRQVRILRHASGAETAVMIDYAEWLGLTPGSTVYGSADVAAALRTEAGDVIMPVRLDS